MTSTGASRRAVVDTHIGQPIDAGDVGAQGDDRHAGARQFLHRVANDRMVDALKRNTRAAASRDREQAVGKRLRIDALDRDDLDINTMRRARRGQCFGQNLGRSARMRGKEDVETSAAARRDPMAEIAPRDFANGIFNPRDRFLMDAAAPVDHPVNRRGADARFGGNIGDLGPAREDRHGRSFARSACEK